MKMSRISLIGKQTDTYELTVKLRGGLSEYGWREGHAKAITKTTCLC
jgi:hypothetical protein